MAAATVSQEELEKFGAMAAEWWDPAGKFRPLHRINPVRLAFVREQVLAHFGGDGAVRHPFAGLSVIDIGCGGGLATEPMARLGATVTGADPEARNIAIARIHAAEAGLDIDYVETTAEAIAASGRQFDVVLCLEVVEHVADPALFLSTCAALVRPGGLMVLATINRTARAFALAIVGAEYVLRWLPRGTHAYEKFLTPEEIGSMLGRAGLSLRDRTGVVYSPLADDWRRSRDMSVNYMLAFEKPQ